jgi:SAM-dependent methyltransferase
LRSYSNEPAWVDAKTHYDRLIAEGNDPVCDPPALQTHMDRWDGPLFLQFLRLRLAGTSRSCLEIGVGTGRLAMRVCAFCRDFTGIDLSPRTLAAARRHLRRFSQARLYRGDFLTYDFQRLFAVIYSSLTFFHIADKALAIQKVAALLEPGGFFLLSVSKDQCSILDFGGRRVRLYPDSPTQTAALLRDADLTILAQTETDAAWIFAAEKAAGEIGGFSV